MFREALGQIGVMLAKIGGAGGGLLVIVTHGLDHWRVTLAFAGMAVVGTALRLIYD